MSFGDVQRLRALALVLDLGSVSAAAEVLGYTQSAVSQQLVALEREAGAELVDRSQRPLRATPAGAALRPHAERVLAAVAGAEAAVGDVRGGMRRVRLVAFPSALSSFVPRAVRDLRRAHGDVVVQVAQLETAEAVEALHAGEGDLAVVHHMPGAPVPDTSAFHSRPLLSDPLRLVLPEGHPLARRREVAVADLEGVPLALPRRDTPAARFRSLVERLFAQAGIEPVVAYEIDDLPAAQAFAAVGIAAVPMHELTLATVPAGAVVRTLSGADAATRAVEALAPAGARPAVVDDLLGLLARAARARRRKKDTGTLRSTQG